MPTETTYLTDSDPFDLTIVRGVDFTLEVELYEDDGTTRLDTEDVTWVMAGKRDATSCTDEFRITSADGDITDDELGTLGIRIPGSVTQLMTAPSGEYDLVGTWPGSEPRQKLHGSYTLRLSPVKGV